MTERRSTFVKICGITRLVDARVAVRAGANAIGFVFAPSPRRVSPVEAHEIGAHIHPSLRKIGVFVNSPNDQILEVVDLANLDGVQLQGTESAEIVTALKKSNPNLFVTQVVRALDEASVREASAGDADAVMVDTRDPSHPEVNAGPIPSSWLGGASIAKLIVAGGLTPSNVGWLVQEARPWGVDTSSGVESGPGRKDPDKIRAFMKAVREADARKG